MFQIYFSDFIKLSNYPNQLTKIKCVSCRTIYYNKILLLSDTKTNITKVELSNDNRNEAVSKDLNKTIWKWQKTIKALSKTKFIGLVSQYTTYQRDLEDLSDSEKRQVCSSSHGACTHPLSTSSPIVWRWQGAKVSAAWARITPGDAPPTAECMQHARYVGTRTETRLAWRYTATNVPTQHHPIHTCMGAASRPAPCLMGLCAFYRLRNNWIIPFQLIYDHPERMCVSGGCFFYTVDFL